MTFLPIVGRELRVAARRPATYRVRFFAALAVLAFGFVTLGSAPASTPTHQISETIFALEAVISFAFCLLSGVFLTADCLSVEKRDGTLGLLFLTDLNGFDVVLGKLAATSIQSIYGLLAIFPMLGLSLLLGGVTSGEFARVLLALLLVLLFSLAMGLAVSAAGRETRRTMVLTFGLLFFFAGLFPAFAWLQEIFLGGGAVIGNWFLPSPVGVLMTAFDSYYRAGRGPAMFWTSVGIFCAFVLGALSFASLLLPRSFREEERELAHGSKISFGWRARFRIGRRSPARRAKLELNPFYWLAARERLVRLIVWVAVVTLGAIWSGFVVGAFATRQSGRGDDAVGISFLTAFALHVVLKGIVALEASRRLSEDHHSGALELLLATPLLPRTILRGQWLALREHFAKPILAVLLVNGTLFWLVGFSKSAFGTDPELRTAFCAMCLGGALVLLLDVRALSWVGMLTALRSKSHARAVLATLGRVMLLPWAGIFVFVMLGIVRQGMSEKIINELVILWFVGGAIISLTAAAKAKRRLLSQFRTLASGAKVKLLKDASRPNPLAWRIDPGRCV